MLFCKLIFLGVFAGKHYKYDPDQSAFTTLGKFIGHWEDGMWQDKNIA